MMQIQIQVTTKWVELSGSNPLLLAFDLSYPSVLRYSVYGFGIA